MTLNDAQKRDFVARIIQTVEQNGPLLTEKGFDPANKVSSLKDKSGKSDQAEAAQQQAQVEAKQATTAAQEALVEAYKEASSMVDLMEGLLGKGHDLVKQVKKFRK